MSRHTLAVSLALIVSACGGAPEEAPEFDTLQQRLALFDYSATNTTSATNLNSATFPLVLAANETVMLGTCGINEANPDPAGNNVIRLRNPSGSEVTSWGVYSPGRGCGITSRVSHSALSAGTYTMWAGCSSTTSCSGTVSISRRKALVAYSASNTNNAQLNTYNKQYFFNGGEVIRVSTCSSSSFGASVSSGDTYLRLFRQVSGVYSEVANSNDATGCGTASELTYTIPTAGYYQVRAGCLGNTSCTGNFTVYSE